MDIKSNKWLSYRHLEDLKTIKQLHKEVHVEKDGEPALGWRTGDKKSLGRRTKKYEGRDLSDRFSGCSLFQRGDYRKEQALDWFAQTVMPATTKNNLGISSSRRESPEQHSRFSYRERQEAAEDIPHVANMSSEE